MNFEATLSWPRAVAALTTVACLGLSSLAVAAPPDSAGEEAEGNGEFGDADAPEEGEGGDTDGGGEDEGAGDPAGSGESDGDGDGDGDPHGEGDGDGDGEDAGESEADEDAGMDDPKRKRAAEKFFQARMAYDVGRFDDAIAGFEEAWELSNEPAMLFNIAQAYWRRGDVNKSVEDLRKARTLFTSYDKHMQAAAANQDANGDAAYNPREVQGIIAALEAQIEYAEYLQSEKSKGPGQVGPTPQEMRLEQRRKTTKALHASGTSLIVVGALSGAAALAGLIGRGATKFMLDQSGGGEAGKSNQNSVSEDRKLRRSFDTTGTLAFATLITTGIILPVGVGLKVTAQVRDREDGRLKKDIDEKRRLRQRLSLRRGRKLELEPAPALLRVRF